MQLRPLEAYDVSADRGFLCKYDAARVALPDSLDTVRHFAMSLPDRIVTGRARRDIDRLDEVPAATLEAIADDAVLRAALVHYAFLAQAYVWCEDDVPAKLPRAIARPLWALAGRVGQPPILTYSQYVLDNWSCIDQDGPVDLGNTRMVQPFIAGQDEAWFVLVHVAIEAAAGRMLARIPAAIAAADAGATDTLTAELEAMLGVWDEMQAAFNRMPERCDPYIYFQRVRPWIHGWKDNPAMPDGIVYEGVEETGGRPQSFRGQTGSQSSIVPVMDALLAIGHGHDPLRGYLDELHVYRPPGHRAFIDEVRAASSVRETVARVRDPSLTEAYNDCLERLTRFRTRHLEYAASYIHKQSRGTAGNATDVGTGGTPFMKYLKKHRDEANAHRL
jgi:indoleamine 2,3-dioxygenase